MTFRLPDNLIAWGQDLEEVLQRLEERPTPVYWTAIHGYIPLVTNGEGVSVRTQQTAAIDPLV